MKINKGTKKAEALFAQLRAEGDLVDVYSKEFFDRQPSIKDKKDALFT